MAEVLAAAGGVIAALMLLTWLISVLVNDASIVDIVWGFGLVVATWTTYIVGDPTARGLLTAVLVSIWGLRLTIYLAWRNLGKPEDHRYQAMRRKHPDSFWLRSLLTVFLLQGALMWIVALAPVSTQVPPADGSVGLGWVDYLGAGIWLIGLVFETVGDLQLARFKSQPGSKGKVMDRGLWRYTRHPNYFGDFCVWWGLFLIALANGAWWAVVSPIVMSVLLLRVSGVRLLEKGIVRRRPEYARYIETTNAFFPGPPRADKSVTS